MKICILKESLAIGGTERSAANVSKVLCEDYEVYMTLYDAADIKYSFKGQLVDFSLPPKPTFAGKVVNTILRDIKLRKFLRKEKVNLVYMFTTIGNRQTRYKYKTPKIISARDFGKMQERYKEYKVALNHSEAMICNSEYTKKYYLSHYPMDKDKVFTVYNYIDVLEIRKQAEENVEDRFIEFLNAHQNIIVSTGRFCKEKGFEYLIKAFAYNREKYNDIGLVLVGDGDYKQNYLNLIKQLGIEQYIYFTGFQKNPYKYIKKCNCFVLSSLSEGFPNVLAEAMALGLPVIATNCYSGPAEILRDDCDYEAVTDSFVECDYGIITPRITEKENKNAITQLAKAIELLSKDESKKAYYSQKSSQRAEAFSAGAARKQFISIFSKLINGR